MSLKTHICPEIMLNLISLLHNFIQLCMGDILVNIYNTSIWSIQVIPILRDLFIFYFLYMVIYTSLISYDSFVDLGDAS